MIIKNGRQTAEVITEDNRPINMNLTSNLPDNNVQTANKIMDNIKMFEIIWLVRPRIGIVFLLVGISIYCKIHIDINILQKWIKCVKKYKEDC